MATDSCMCLVECVYCMTMMSMGPSLGAYQKRITNWQLQVVAVPRLHEMKYAQTRQTTGSQ